MRNVRGQDLRREGISGVILRAEGEGPRWSCRKWKYSFYLREVRRWKGEASGDNAVLRSPRSFAGNWVLKLVTEPGACPGAEPARRDRAWVARPHVQVLRVLCGAEFAKHSCPRAAGV